MRNVGGNRMNFKQASASQNSAQAHSDIIDVEIKNVRSRASQVKNSDKFQKVDAEKISIVYEDQSKKFEYGKSPSFADKLSELLIKGQNRASQDQQTSELVKKTKERISNITNEHYDNMQSLGYSRKLAMTNRQVGEMLAQASSMPGLPQSETKALQKQNNLGFFA